jgi:hypothetical protein
MKRSNKSTIAICILAGFLTPVLAGALAWRYVDESTREGLLYLWLYRLPTVMPEQLTGSTWLGYVITALIYSTVYLSIVHGANLARDSFKKSQKVP